MQEYSPLQHDEIDNYDRENHIETTYEAIPTSNSVIWVSQAACDPELAFLISMAQWPPSEWNGLVSPFFTGNTSAKAEAMPIR